MSMTRKHFEQIANILRNNRFEITSDQHDKLILDFAAYLSTQNANFNTDRFYAASGYYDDDQPMNKCS